MGIQDNIIIYTAKMNFNICDIEFKNALSCLTEEEQEKILLRRTYKARCESLISTLLKKKAIIDTLGLRENSFKIKTNEMNRPYIETKEKIHIDFNISHSNQWIVCVISKSCKIGIDIEEMLPIDINIAKEFLAKDEWEYLHNYEGKKINAFYRFWTLKESLVKAIGTGINESIKEINFKKLDNENNILKKEVNNDMWHFYQCTFKDNYALSLASDKEINNVIFKNYEELYNLNL